VGPKKIPQSSPPPAAGRENAENLKRRASTTEDTEFTETLKGWTKTKKTSFGSNGFLTEER
jgi:hypothetical protein